MVAFQRLPCRCPNSGPRCCAVCGSYHTEEMPHHLGSAFYRERFRCKWGRWPTWEDAVAHLRGEEKGRWFMAVAKAGCEWSSPSSPPLVLAPVAEPFVPWGIEP